MAPMNLEDLDRRIAELRSVENWLRMNLSMLSSTIQGMEVQRSTISTLRAFVDSAANMDMAAVRESGAASPLEVVLGAEARAQARLRARGAGKTSQDAAQEPPAATPGMSEQMGAAAQSASKAWWDLLQQQFNQIAAATAASMPAAPGADSLGQGEAGSSVQGRGPGAKPAAAQARRSSGARRRPARKRGRRQASPLFQSMPWTAARPARPSQTLWNLCLT